MWPGPATFDVPGGCFALVVTTPGVASALIRLLVGLRSPRAGEVEVLGVRPGRLGRWQSQQFRRRLGVGFDDPAGLVSNLSLRMNLVVPMLYSGLRDDARARDDADAILDRLELGEWADSRPADVPPEIRREAVLARALVRRPELLLVEEPTTGLRDGRAGWLLDRCREYARTVLMTTAERDGVPHGRADTILSIDTSGIEIRHHEVGAV